MRLFPIAAAFALTACALPAQDIVLPEGKAKTLVQNSCSDCHGLDQVVTNPQTRDEWRATVNKMVRRGAALSPAEIDLVVDYLSVYFAPDKTNVNTAEAKELQSALDITEAQAKAIVDYREKSGKIADIAALAKASGVDQKKLEAKKDVIAY